MAQPSVKAYQNNHPHHDQEAALAEEEAKVAAKNKIKEVDPYARKEESSPFMRSAEVIANAKRSGKSRKEIQVSARNSVMAELANNLKRSSSHLSQNGSGMELIADEYFREHYRLPGGFFTIKNPEEA